MLGTGKLFGGVYTMPAMVMHHLGTGGGVYTYRSSNSHMDVMAGGYGRKTVHDIQVELDQHIYNPGETITGTVICNLNQKLYCDELVVNFYGAVRVFFTEQSVSDSSHMLRKTTAFEQKIVLVDKEQRVWEDQTVNNLLKGKPVTLDDILRRSSSTAIRQTAIEKSDCRRGIEPGVHRFPFTFEVPETGMHTSFESKNSIGTVRYYMIVLARLNGMNMARRKHLFPIVVPSKLSDDVKNFDAQRREQKTSVKKYVRDVNGELCHPLRLGDVAVALSLEKSGFVPGEPLAATVTILNNTKKSIKCAHLNIVQKATCIASEPFSNTIDATFETSGCGLPVWKLEAGRSIEYLSRFNIPALTPNLDIPFCILVDYEVKLRVGFARGSPSQAFLTVTIPIKIGTQRIDLHAPPPLTPEDEKENNLLFVETPQSPARLPSAPPTYEESVNGVDPEKVDYDNDYAPLYYSYVNEQQASEGTIVLRTGIVPSSPQ